MCARRIRVPCTACSQLPLSALAAACCGWSSPCGVVSVAWRATPATCHALFVELLRREGVRGGGRGEGCVPQSEGCSRQHHCQSPLSSLPKCMLVKVVVSPLLPLSVSTTWGWDSAASAWGRPRLFVLAARPRPVALPLFISTGRTQHRVFAVLLACSRRHATATASPHTRHPRSPT